MRTTKNGTEKIQEPRETHQCDHAEAAKYLRGAADVLEGREKVRGEEKEERRSQHMSSVKNKSK